MRRSESWFLRDRAPPKPSQSQSKRRDNDSFLDSIIRPMLLMGHSAPRAIPPKATNAQSSQPSQSAESGSRRRPQSFLSMSLFTRTSRNRPNDEWDREESNDMPSSTMGTAPPPSWPSSTLPRVETSPPASLVGAPVLPMQVTGSGLSFSAPNTGPPPIPSHQCVQCGNMFSTLDRYPTKCHNCLQSEHDERFPGTEWRPHIPLDTENKGTARSDALETQSMATNVKDHRSNKKTLEAHNESNGVAAAVAACRKGKCGKRDATVLNAIVNSAADTNDNPSQRHLDIKIEQACTALNKVMLGNPAKDDSPGLLDVYEINMSHDDKQTLCQHMQRSVTMLRHHTSVCKDTSCKLASFTRLSREEQVLRFIHTWIEANPERFPNCETLRVFHEKTKVLRERDGGCAALAWLERFPTTNHIKFQCSESTGSPNLDGGSPTKRCRTPQLGSGSSTYSSPSVHSPSIRGIRSFIISSFRGCDIVSIPTFKNEASALLECTNVLTLVISMKRDFGGNVTSDHIDTFDHIIALILYATVLKRQVRLYTTGSPPIDGGRLSAEAVRGYNQVADRILTKICVDKWNSMDWEGVPVKHSIAEIAELIESYIQEEI